jgi:hypothetical protein
MQIYVDALISKLLDKYHNTSYAVDSYCHIKYDYTAKFPVKSESKIWIIKISAYILLITKAEKR